MANKSKKELKLEQIKANLIVWWVAVICLVGICFVSVIYFQNQAGSSKIIEKLASIKVTEAKNYGTNVEPVNVSIYSTLINGISRNVYSLDPESEISKDEIYPKKSRIDDDGIISILKNGTYISNIYNEEEKKAIIQLAIWIYKDKLNDDQENVILKGKYGNEIKSLLKKANSETYTQSSVVLSTKSPAVSLSKDKKYYLSEAINLSFSNKVTVVNYKVNLENAPKGTKIIDEKGQEIKDITTVSKFYLKIPEENVNGNNKYFTIGLDVTTSNYYAYEFRTKKNQSDEADVILDDLQVSFAHTQNSIELNVPKETSIVLVDQRTIIGFLALCVTSAICGIIIFLIKAFQVKPKAAPKKRTTKTTSKPATKAATKSTTKTKAKTTKKTTTKK